MPNDKALESMLGVRDFVESLGGTPDSFHAKLDVVVTGAEDYLFKSVDFCTFYVASYIQYEVDIGWEDDKSKPDYHDLGLFGRYNTNFQSFSFVNGKLVFCDGDNRINVMPF